MEMAKPKVEGTPPDFERFFLEKRPRKRFSTNVLIRGEMNPLHKHKIMSVGYQVKQISKSRSELTFKNVSLEKWSYKLILLLA